MEEDISEAMQKYQAEMKNGHKEKQHIITYCEKVLRDEELMAEKKCVDMIKDFQGYKKHKLRDLDALEDKGLQIDEFE